MAAHPQSGWIFSASVPRRPRREPGEGLLLHAAHKSPRHSTQPHVSQIMPGWQRVTSTQKEGRPGCLRPAWSFPSYVLIKQETSQGFLSHLFPPLPALALPGVDTGHQESSGFSQGRSPPTLHAKFVTCSLGQQSLFDTREQFHGRQFFHGPGQAGMVPR